MNNRYRWAVGELGRPGSDGDWTLRYFRPGSEFEALNRGHSFDELYSLGYRGYPAFNPKRELHDAGVAEAFKRRIPPKRRPDFQDYKRQFRLAPDLDPSDFALLGLTEAKLPSDGFSIVDPLDGSVASCDLMLEIAGYRYYAQNGAITVEVGEPVDVLAELGNAKDVNAVQICADGRKIGNINRLQAGAFQRWLAERNMSAVIERLNGKPNWPRAFIFVRVRPEQTRVAA
jgi:hypothetical protein